MHLQSITINHHHLFTSKMDDDHVEPIVLAAVVPAGSSNNAASTHSAADPSSRQFVRFELDMLRTSNLPDFNDAEPLDHAAHITPSLMLSPHAHCLNGGGNQFSQPRHPIPPRDDPLIINESLSTRANYADENVPPPEEGVIDPTATPRPHAPPLLLINCIPLLNKQMVVDAMSSMYGIDEPRPF